MEQETRTTIHKKMMPTLMMCFYALALTSLSFVFPLTAKGASTCIELLAHNTSRAHQTVYSDPLDFYGVLQNSKGDTVWIKYYESDGRTRTAAFLIRDLPMVHVSALDIERHMSGLIALEDIISISTYSESLVSDPVPPRILIDAAPNAPPRLERVQTPPIAPLAPAINFLRTSPHPRLENFTYYYGQTTALSYIYDIEMAAPTGLHKLQIIIPESFHGRYGSAIIDNVLQLPIKHLVHVSHVWLQPFDYYGHSMTTKSANTIVIFPNALGYFRDKGFFNFLYVLTHEQGHIVASKTYGSPQPGADYIKAMQRDPHIISEYARQTKSAMEDYAEGYAHFVRSQGGVLMPGLRDKTPYRFEIFDKMFQISP